MNLHDRPLATKGLTSYRLKSRYGWIMIGAKDHEDAMREAARSTADPKIEALEVWDGERYAPVLDEASKAVRVAYDAWVAADQAWSAELEVLYGREAGDARYDHRNKASPKLRDLHAAFAAAGEAWGKLVDHYRALEGRHPLVNA